MTGGNEKKRRIKSAWETIRDIVTVLSGATLLVGSFLYVEKLVIANLGYIIITALVIFIVGLSFVGVARFSRLRGERIIECAEESAQRELKELNNAPVSVVREKVTIGERDPVATGLRHLVIPLNKRPDGEWIKCFENLPVVYLSLQEANVVGASIETLAAENAIPKTVEAITDLVARTNLGYEKFLKGEAERIQRERIRKEEEDKRLRDLESKARGQSGG